MSSQKRILTGDRPTGRLHLGHYVGSIKARVALQHEYETFLLIADLHMLTTKNSKQDIERIDENARQMVIDYLACGIDPNLVTIYLQSAVHETYELNTLFQNLVTVPRLERLPSLKDMARLTSLSGVGKKTAQRLCMELGEKVGAFALDSGAAAGGMVTAPPATEGFAMQDAASALVNLGYPQETAWQALRTVQQADPDKAGEMQVDELIRAALRSLA